MMDFISVLSFIHGFAEVPAVRYLAISHITHECSLKLHSLSKVLNNASIIKIKPLEVCLPLPLVLKVSANFYAEIEIIVFSLLCCLLD